MQKWKRSLRISLKYAQNLFSGYPFAYAWQQTPQLSCLYPHLWSESVTAIPDRGTPEIRKNRILNLQLAAKKIHELKLDSRQIFSFCNRVGDPTLKKGFQAGPVFVRGQVQKGVGGGLCLIATNLFNTFLVSGCQILERHCHSIDAYGDDRFYQLGQDASVAYGYKDLIVRNQSSVSLQLRLQVLPEAGQVISSLWGQSPRPWQVKVNSVILQELPSPLATDFSGWIVSTQQYIGDRDENSRLKARSPNFKEAPLRWKLNYYALSIYHPCAGSRVESIVDR